MARRPDLSTAQRLAIAKLSGTVERFVLRDRQDADVRRDEADEVGRVVDELHEVSRDPGVLGEVLGAYLARAEYLLALQPAVELLRAAGADEDVAAARAAWLRERYPNGLL